MLKSLWHLQPLSRLSLYAVTPCDHPSSVLTAAFLSPICNILRKLEPLIPCYFFYLIMFYKFSLFPAKAVVGSWSLLLPLLLGWPRGQKEASIPKRCHRIRLQALYLWPRKSHQFSAHPSWDLDLTVVLSRPDAAKDVQTFTQNAPQCSTAWHF